MLVPVVNQAKLLKTRSSYTGLSFSVALTEDDCRIRKDNDNTPENFAVLRHIAVNLLSKEKRVKGGIKNKQFLAAMDNNYLTQLLALA